MLSRAASFQRGVNLIELMTVLAVVGVVLALGVPAYSEWIQNTQIRTASESMLVGVKLARAEALKRNEIVHFQMMTSSTDASCGRSATGVEWVVSVDDASGMCDATDSSQPPRIVRRNARTAGTSNVTYQSAQTGNAAFVGTVDFDALGRLVTAGDVTIDIMNSSGTCAADASDGKMRCLRILVTSGGQIRMCDPAVSASGDTRKC
jgi:type IV fimbrial biogenesis protein FimT